MPLVLALGAGSAVADGARRIISTAPSLTETLFAIGAGDRVVGVTTFCEYPEAALALPKIGGFADASVESILALRPDLVVMVEGRRSLAEQLSQFDIPGLVVDPSDLSGILDTIRRLADAAGTREQGEALASRIEAELAAARTAVADRKRRVLLLVGRNPGSLTALYAVGATSFLGELLEHAGGENILADSSAAYPKVSLEQVLARDPDVIIELAGMERGDPARHLRDALALWGRYPNLKAVKSGAIVVLAEDRLLQPGPQVADTVWRLAEALHGVHRPD
jgi:iron complex transport system substrate-binding protein